jgi:hypothetical protein
METTRRGGASASSHRFGRPRSAGDTVTADSSRADALLEVVATVLLALAAVATAWSGYQASRWNGEAAKASGHANKLRIEAARAQGLAEAQEGADLATFTQWVDAYLLHRPEVANFYFKRFRTEFKPAVVAWIATRPLKNPNAPPSPFAMPEYQLAAANEAKGLDAEADVSSATKDRNIQRATDYVLGVVLFSVALFFAGMSVKLPLRRLRIVLLAFGIAIFLGTAAWIATSPISFSI